jgi:superfamily II DNA or RNA helicase
MISGKGFLLSGFLPYLEKRFNVKMEGSFEPQKLDFDLSLAKKAIDLRPYQGDALRLAVRDFRGQIIMPPRTGKTIVAASVLKSLPRARSLFVVQSKDLLNQTREVFERYLKQYIGFVGIGREEWQQHTVALIQSLKKYSPKKNPVDVLMIDESHHSAASTYEKLLKKINCPMKLGFTATERPDKEGWLKCLGLLGPVIYKYPYQEAVADGWLSQIIVRMLKAGLDMDTASAKGFRKVYNAGIIGHEERNIAIVEEAKSISSEGQTCLILVKEIKHGKVLENMFNGTSTFLCGGDHDQLRLKVKDLLNVKKIKICITSPIWDEGIDIPELDCVINAGAGMSEIKTIQRGTRGATKVEGGKDTTTLIDFYDSSHKYLRKHSRQRVETYKEKGWQVVKEY